MMMLDFYLLLLLIRLHSTGDKETVSIYSVFYLKKEKKGKIRRGRRRFASGSIENELAPAAKSPLSIYGHGQGKIARRHLLSLLLSQGDVPLYKAKFSFIKSDDPKASFFLSFPPLYVCLSSSLSLFLFIYSLSLSFYLRSIRVWFKKKKKKKRVDWDKQGHWLANFLVHLGHSFRTRWLDFLSVDSNGWMSGCTCHYIFVFLRLIESRESLVNQFADLKWFKLNWLHLSFDVADHSFVNHW